MTTAKTILLVDDDQELREAPAEQFELHEGFRIEHAGSAGEGIKKAEETQGRPHHPRRRAARHGRARRVPSHARARHRSADRHADRAGDGCGRNPWSRFRRQRLCHQALQVLRAARPRARALRTFEQSEDATFRLGPYEFRPAAKLLIDEKDRKIRLTEKETNILKYLYRAGGKPVGREELLSEVWGYNANVTTHTLETHIYRLRQKIEPDPANARLLLTESGGYRLQA